MINERDAYIRELENLATERLNIIENRDSKIKEDEEKLEELKRIINNHFMSRREYGKKFGGDI